MWRKIFQGSANIFILVIIVGAMAAGAFLAGGFPTSYEDLIVPTPTPLPTQPQSAGTATEEEEDIEQDVAEAPIVSGGPPETEIQIKMADLVILDFKLTDENGREKTTFDRGEKIYPKVTFNNRGTGGIKGNTEFILSQIYTNRFLPAPVNTLSDANIWIRNGMFGKGTLKTYGAYPTHAEERLFKGAHSWTKNTQGTYTAQVFINYNHAGIESNYDNNYRTIRYTITNKVAAPAELSFSGNGSAAPNNTTCNGRYNFNNPLGKNFGDPECSFTKDKLFTALKQADPGAASFWFYTVIPCESPGYDPNLFFRNSPAGGAWGLFQMDWGHRSDSPPGQGLNGIYDRGDVAWPKQVTNATTFRIKMRGGSWRYWECAKSRW